MERTERFYKIQNLLRSRQFVRTQEFMDELGVSRATFKRDLEYLRDRMHAPIEYDRDHEAYGFDPAVADSAAVAIAGPLVLVRRTARAADDGPAARRPAARRAVAN